MLSILLLTLISNSQAADTTWMEAIKKNCHQTIMQGEATGFSSRFPMASPQIDSPILDNDRAEDLVEDPSRMIQNIQVMDQQKLTEKYLSVAPWSDTYWPLYLGAIAQRYNDPNYTSYYRWEDAQAYITKNPASSLIKNKTLEILAPSEKYDYLLSVKDHTLTQSSWKMGAEYQKENGTVETWMGLCHGWSPASFMMPNPLKKVVVNTASGPMNFNPSDIKALGTFLWAQGKFQSRFIGGRCNSTHPQTDSMERPTDPDCLDTNPGTWHKAIVNQIGLFNRAFIMDASADYQVWNQPVYGYQYSYVNPKTGADAASLKEAMVNRSDWPNDPRKSVRAPNSKSIVGIQMNVKYVVENSPSTDENQITNFSTVVYRYDLELNAQLDIIGGEWHSNNHPDFLWVPVANSYPTTVGDNGEGQLNLNEITPAMKKLANQNAALGLPLGSVVRTLFQESSH